VHGEHSANRAWDGGIPSGCHDCGRILPASVLACWDMYMFMYALICSTVLIADRADGLTSKRWRLAAVFSAVFVLVACREGLYSRLTTVKYMLGNPSIARGGLNTLTACTPVRVSEC